MTSFFRGLTVAGVGGLMLLLSPECFPQLPAKAARTRMSTPPQATATAAVTPPAAPPQPVNMLQQPPRDAQVAFSGDRLSIHAENSSLAAILRQVAAQSGMKISGLGIDERVFGAFGPGNPSDVLTDLLNGTAYDLMLVGTASHAAPRELILTPSKAAGQTQSASFPPPSPATPDDAVNDQESQDSPLTPPEVLPAASATPPGVRTPQQLFQQLQQMRQAQQQQIPQQEPPQQTPPQ